MKQFLTVCLLFLSFSLKAQDVYSTKTNIPYYQDSTGHDQDYKSSRCLLDVYYPKNIKDFSTIIWFHGGGLTGGGKFIPKELMGKGYAVIGVGYRLSPKAKAPAYIEDAAAAVAWVFNHISEFGGNDKKIYLSGHSAGGYLAMLITLNKSYLEKYHIDANQIAELIPFSGQCITHFTVRAEKGIKETQPTIDEYAPLYWVRPDAPPIMLITGDAELELYGRFEENAYMLRMMKLVGHKKTRLLQLQGYDHGGMATPAFPLLLSEIANHERQRNQ
ncbi:alpha/beta hydrolase [Mucilaginibacter ginkgonis]|uniref:Alpha/beta hydrolase n=1 Tax=Mucilaginibacter ginkgonis TaxID=2682091 RepID=A0A6I4HZX1_9SPHI|nr:alpha/beta hydrolase [Mucilaginibacter ginkgonis]QQL49978.1 alpha/beta hydrolase [Mucilaginibacter ginkgonis]